MSKENSYLKSFFSKKERNDDARTDNTDDYTIKRNQKVDIIIRIFAVVCAIIVWVYAVTSNSTTKEFQNIPVTVKRIAMVETQGYTIQYEDLKVNFKIQGKVAIASQVTEKSIEVYADVSTVKLSDITDSQVFKLPLIYNLPSDVVCIEKSQEYIEVTITKITSGIKK